MKFKITFILVTVLALIISCTDPTSNQKADKNSKYDDQKYRIIDLSQKKDGNVLVSPEVGLDTKFSYPDSVMETINFPDSLKAKTNGYTGYEFDSEWFTENYNYNIDKIEGRTVTGDFDGDGYNDVATFYDYGNSTTKIHVFLSKHPNVSYGQRGYNYQGNNGWWSNNQYNANSIKGRVVAGDFDGDNDDDIAAIYNYGANDDAIHVWLSTGSSFSYQGNNGWRTLNQYDVNKITDRVVAGDFDGDNDDDIAAIYDYGANDDAIHVWLSTGSSFSYQGNNGWGTLNQYDVNKITGRVIAGDFNGDNDDDIAAIYDYGSSSDKVHVWLSTGSSFSYQGNNGWLSLPSDTKEYAQQVVSGYFDQDDEEDIAFLEKPDGYPTNNQIIWAPFSNWPDPKVKVRVNLSTGSSFQGGQSTFELGSSYGAIPYSYSFAMPEFFNPNKHIALSGDFDGDGDHEVISFSETLTFLALEPDNGIPRDYTYIYKTTDLKVTAY